MRNYGAELSDLFAFNAVFIVSHGIDALMDTLTTGRKWFKP